MGIIYTHERVVQAGQGVMVGEVGIDGVGEYSLGPALVPTYCPVHIPHPHTTHAGLHAGLTPSAYSQYIHSVVFTVCM